MNHAPVLLAKKDTNMAKGCIAFSSAAHQSKGSGHNIHEGCGTVAGGQEEGQLYKRETAVAWGHIHRDQNLLYKIRCPTVRSSVRTVRCPDVPMSPGSRSYGEMSRCPHVPWKPFVQ